MSTKPRREAPSFGVEHVDPPYVPNFKRPGDERSALRHAALEEPRAQPTAGLALATNAAMVVMCCLLAAVVVTVLVLLVTRV
jgi:hypothetical protein